MELDMPGLSEELRTAEMAQYFISHYDSTVPVRMSVEYRDVYQFQTYAEWITTKGEGVWP